MEWLREWGLALILGFGSSCAVAQDKGALEQRIDHYKLGVELRKEADREEKKEVAQELYARALKHFLTEKETGPKKYLARVQEADITSCLGDFFKALELSNKIIEEYPTDESYYARGIIEQRHALNEDAVISFTKSIELKDTAPARWARFFCYVPLAVTRREIKLEFAEKALEDANKYIEFFPEHPDGFILKTMAQCLIAKAKYNKPHDEEAFKSFQHAFYLIDHEKKEFQKAMFRNAADKIREDYDKMRKEYVKRREY